MNFDPSLEANWGRPLYFSLEDHIKAVEGLIKSDEIEMAFKLLDMVPAWYREHGNYPKELTRIKKILWENLYSPMTYINDAEEAEYTYEKTVEQVKSGYCFPRLDILKQVVEKLNNPWIFELSTSHGPIPVGLKESGHKFNFFAKNFNQAALMKVKEWLGPEIWRESPKVDQPTVFVNFEVLEHCHRPEDVRDDYYKLGIDFDYILLSVPLGCLGGGLDNWSTRRLGHVRGFATQEFLKLANDFFPGFKWQLYRAPSMVLVGEHVAKES